MVFILVALTFAVFITVGYFLKRENEEMVEKEKSQKSPIFLSPEKALLPIPVTESRRYHISHTWAQPEKENLIYVGFDDLIPYLFSDKVKLAELAEVGTYLNQGDRIWRLEQGNRSVYQTAPLTGVVKEINPAISTGLPLESDRISPSWILKLEDRNRPDEYKNLLNQEQASIMNRALREQINGVLNVSSFLNDGGLIDPGFLKKINSDTWDVFIRKFFPY